MAKTKAKNVNVNVNMQPQMVQIMERLIAAMGCSTRAELVRVLVREEAKRQGISLTKKRKR